MPGLGRRGHAALLGVRRRRHRRDAPPADRFRRSPPSPTARARVFFGAGGCRGRPEPPGQRGPGVGPGARQHARLAVPRVCERGVAAGGVGDHPGGLPCR